MFVSSTAAVKTQLPNQHPQQQQQRACHTCGKTNHLSRSCPKNRKENSTQPKICRNYNHFSKSNCEDDNKCKYGRKQHCQFCNKRGCKAIKHPENRPSSTARNTTSDEVDSLRQQLVVLSTGTQLEKYESQCQEKNSSSNPMGSSNQASTSVSRLPPPVASDQPSLSTPLFGLPAVTIPAPSAKPKAQLHQRNILWTSVTSAGQCFPLPLDSCCSVSLVSKVHADFIASKRPNLKYCPLEEPISVTAADPKSNP